MSGNSRRLLLNIGSRQCSSKPQPRRRASRLFRPLFEAKGFEVEIGGGLFADAMGTPGTPEGTYLGMMRHNIDTIVNASRAELAYRRQ